MIIIRFCFLVIILSACGYSCDSLEVVLLKNRSGIVTGVLLKNFYPTNKDNFSISTKDSLYVAPFLDGDSLPRIRLPQFAVGERFTFEINSGLMHNRMTFVCDTVCIAIAVVSPPVHSR